MTEFKFNPRDEIFRQFKDGEDGSELEADEKFDEKFDEFCEEFVVDDVVVDETELDGEIAQDGDPGSEED